MAKKSSTKTSVRRMSKRLYKAELKRLQIELVEMQRWVAKSGARVVVIFEGRDAAGKGGAIKRVTGYLNPRHTRVVALSKPVKRERGQWYFQRYIEHLPSKGEIVLMDRSWYNRAGVERVMGYCTDEQYQRFLRQAPVVEQHLIEDGIILIKYWFSVSDEEQQARFLARREDPMKLWKLSPTDLESIRRWENYSRAKDAMFAATDTPGSPWWVVESDDKRSARLNAISHLLESIPYQHLERPKITIPDRPQGGRLRATTHRAVPLRPRHRRPTRQEGSCENVKRGRSQRPCDFGGGWVSCSTRSTRLQVCST